MRAIDNFVRKRKQVKADRAMEQGIAGWQAAMNALNPGFERMLTDSVNMKTGASVALGRGYVRTHGEDDAGFTFNEKGGYEGVIPAKVNKNKDK